MCKLEPMARPLIMRVAIEGCCHGELHKIYAALAKESEPVDLLIICGDFQVSS